MTVTNYINGRIFTQDPAQPYLGNGYISVAGNRIAAMGPMSAYAAEPGIPIVDLGGQIVLPGIIHSHSHFYGQLIRGIPLSCSPANWQQILSEMWWRVDKKLDDQMNYYSAMMGLIDGIEGGTTTYIDHHASPCHSRGSLSLLKAALDEVGARAALAYEVTDRDGPELCRNGIEENCAFIRENNRPGNRVQGAFGLHASYTLSDETLLECAARAGELGVGFHIHVAEDRADVSDSYRRCNKHVVSRLRDFGVLGPKTIAAHCVHVGPEQRAILRETGTMVAHNCQSNTNNAVGVAPVWQMLQEGVCVGLGGDGYCYDSFKELAFAAMQQKLYSNDPRVMGAVAQEKLLFQNNFRIAGTFFDNIGPLKAGNLADFIAIDYGEPTPLDETNLISHATSGFSGNVATVVIDGALIYKDREFVKLDKREIRAKCREQAKRLWKYFA